MVKTKAKKKKTQARKRTKKALAKKVLRKPKAKIKPKRPSTAKTPAGMEKIGEVTHFFPHVNAAAVKILKNSLKIGDEIYVKGHTTDFKEAVASIQLDHETIQEGTKGQEIGLLVKSRTRIGDNVYKIKK